MQRDLSEFMAQEPGPGIIGKLDQDEQRPGSTPKNKESVFYLVEVLKWKGREVPGGHIIPELLSPGALDILRALGGNCSLIITDSMGVII